MIITHLSTKQDLSRWTRQHANAPDINWTTQAGPGGTLIITEHEPAGPVPGTGAPVAVPARA